ncbi:MAG: hypothetical protein ACN6OP_09820 [Pseudomonadales bacterium]
MSYRIEYAHRTLRVDGSEFPDAKDRYIVLAEGGDSNCYGSDNRRSRSWGAIAIGRLEEVLEDGCQLAAACESEGLRLKGRALRPEAYLRLLREQMRKAQPTCSARYRLGLYCRTETDDETDMLLRALPGAARTIERDWDNKPVVVYRFAENGQPDFRLFFSVYPAIRCAKHAWHFVDSSNL